MRETERRLQRLGRAPGDLAAILVTHEHSDHIGGVAALARRYSLPVYASSGTLRSGGIDQLAGSVAIAGGFAIGALTVQPVAVPHDAAEPCQFVFSHRKKSFGLLTDLGSITAPVVAAYRGCDALMLECNHDSALLSAGPYPAALKRRVAGPRGHLSNRQAAELLAALDLARLQRVVMSHLSAKNNTVGLARAELAAVLAGDTVLSADQDAGLDWQEIL
jgi:phosphoribosyl 1,2-cyclic phosphodiesterase